MDKYQISFDEDMQIVRVIAFGDFPQEVGEEIITKARLLAAEHSAGILYDVRQATPRVPLSQWYFLPRELGVLKEKPTRGVKAAIVIPAEQTDEYKFYETVAANVGLTVKLFFGTTEAEKWLTAPNRSDSGA